MAATILDTLFRTVRIILAAMPVLILSACVYGVPIVDPVSAISGVDAAVAKSNEGRPIETRVSGTYENRFWFDRKLYSVSVTADSLEEAEQVAYLVATDSCQKREKSLKIIEISDTESLKKSNNYILRYGAANLPPGFSIRFRCESEENTDFGSGESP